jgi:4-hydroxy-tetrahydrodipicolinate synthase
MELKGIIPAAVCPMTHDFYPDLDSYAEYITWLLQFDIGGIAVNVDTGEAPQLSTKEMNNVLTTCVETAGGSVPIIAGITARYTKEAISQVKDVKECGADAILVFSPPVFSGKIPPSDIAVTYYTDLASVGVPMVIFQLSYEFGGAEFSQETLQKMIDIQEVVAIKEASFNIRKFMETAHTVKTSSRHIFLLTGNDHFIFESLLLGAHGGLLGLSSMSPGLHVQLYNAVKQKKYEKALEIKEKIDVLAHTIYARPFRDYRTRAKEALVMQGAIPAAYVRPPLLPINKKEKESIKAALTEIGLL